MGGFCVDLVEKIRRALRGGFRIEQELRLVGGIEQVARPLAHVPCTFLRLSCAVFPAQGRLRTQGHFLPLAVAGRRVDLFASIERGAHVMVQAVGLRFQDIAIGVRSSSALRFGQIG